MRFTSDKLVYIDFNDIMFSNLYIGKDQSSKECKMAINFSSYLETPAYQPE